MKYQLFTFIAAFFMAFTFSKQCISNTAFKGGAGGGYASVKLKINEVSGLKEQLNYSAIGIYPNPLAAEEALYLVSENFYENEKIILQAYDSNLRLIQQYHVKSTETITAVNLNLPAGFYFLQISTSSMAKTKQLLIY